MSNSSTALQVYEMIKKHLSDHDFKFDTHDDDLVITLTVHGEDLPQPTIIRVDEEREVIHVLSPIPSHIPEDKRIDAAVAVSVANYGLVNGSFDFDMRDGEIRYRVTQGFMGIEVSDELIRYILAVVFKTTDDYNDKFFMLGKGLISLDKFIEMETGN